MGDPANKEKRGACREAVCGGVGRDESVLQAGTTRSRVVSARVGVTSDGAENAPRLRVANGEDSKESGPPGKRRGKTHTASAQDSSAPVPWRWRSRGARISDCDPRQAEIPTGPTTADRHG